MSMIRWLVTTYPEPSIAAVKDYRDRTGCGLQEARKALKTPNTRVLQYLNENQEWVDVPTVTILGE